MIFFFFMFLCICVLVLYLLVVRAASIDGCLCLSGSLPLLSCMLMLILCFEANKYDDDDDDFVAAMGGLLLREGRKEGEEKEGIEGVYF